MVLPILIGLTLGALLITTAFLNWYSDFRKISRITTRVYVTLTTRFTSAYRNQEELLLLTGIIASKLHPVRKKLSMSCIVGQLMMSNKNFNDPSALLPRIRGYGQAEREHNMELLKFILNYELLVYRIKQPEDDIRLLTRLVQKHAYEIEYVMAQSLKRNKVSRKMERAVQGLLELSRDM
jgi:hypothetical protein